MVELLGTHCEYPECNTLDFLPIYCHHCSKTFCKQHGSAPDHSCVSLLQTSSSNSSSLSSSFLPCAYLNNCKNQKSPISFSCSLCLKNFCVEHRHIDDHQCPYRSQSPPTHYSSQLNKNQIQTTTNFPTEKFLGTKNEALANKVAIMKLKQTAKGPTGVPMENRLHVFVQIDNDNKRYPFYLSKLWPLGKGLDYLIKELKLLPTNWIILLNEEQTPLDLSTTISELKQLHDADLIILKKNLSPSDVVLVTPFLRFSSVHDQQSCRSIGIESYERQLSLLDPMSDLISTILVWQNLINEKNFSAIKIVQKFCTTTYIRLFLFLISGPLGFGKSTFLNTLTCRLDVNTIVENEIHLNGFPPDNAELKCISEELRLSRTFKNKESQIRIDDVRHVIIGTSLKRQGISSDEHKRLMC